MMHAPIAITGIGCRFPEATGPEAFWGLLTKGGDAIKEIPANRFDVDAFYDARPGIPGKIYSRWGGFLDQIDQFDPYFFGISPREIAGALVIGSALLLIDGRALRLVRGLFSTPTATP